LFIIRYIFWKLDRGVFETSIEYRKLNHYAIIQKYIKTYRFLAKSESTGLNDKRCRMISKIIFPYVWNEMNRNERMDLKGIIH